MATSSGNPRRAEIEAALAGFYERADADRVPQRRRYHKVVGSAPGTYRYARRKREQQRRNAYNWQVRR